MIGGGAIGETPISALRTEDEAWEASAFDTFILDPVAERIYLVELYPYQEA